MGKSVGWGLLAVVIVGCSGSQAEPAASPEGTFDATSAPAEAGPATPAPVEGAAGETAAPTAAAFTDAVELACAKKARDLEGEGDDNARLVHCPGDCATQGGTIWGTDLYTDDSVVCRALIHAGVLPAAGGHARVTFVRGLPAYVGSEQNGVRASSYGKWGRSFYGQALDATGQATTPAPTLPPEGTARIDCSHRGRIAGAKPDTAMILVCPNGCATAPHSVWGSSPYTSDSNVCAAAIHAGVVPVEGGEVRITLGPGQPSYEGSERHGIKTLKYGKYGASFTLKALK